MYSNDQFDEVIRFGKDVKYFIDIPDVNPIPSNAVIHKSITGIGATYAEITADRNSIIMLPHKSIITNKHADHKDADNTLAVFEGVTEEDIFQYLRSNKKRKKLLTTPLGLEKIKRAMDMANENMYEDYFLLIDECEKWIKDNSYREDILLPINDFFMFRQKAMISATPLRPTDPRIKEFRFIRLEPDYCYKKKISLLQANNPLGSLQEHIASCDSEHICVFFNSVVGIQDIINKLNIADKCKVFCSSESVMTFKLSGFNDAYSDFTELSSFNFFTSSFYSGFDIKVKTSSVSIIILSDVGYALHSILDPHTDIYQILGRFRNGYKDAVHINNVMRFCSAVTEEACIKRISDTRACYETIQTLQRSSADPDIKIIFKEMLERIHPYYNLLDKDGEYNYFKRDNYVYANRVKGYYEKGNFLTTAYTKTDLYHFEVIRIEDNLTNVAKLTRNAGKYTKTTVRDAAMCLHVLEDIRGTEMYLRYRFILNRLYPIVFDAFNKLGIEELESRNFNIRLIKKALFNLQIDSGDNKFPLIDVFYAKFRLDKKYLRFDLKQMIQNIYDELGLDMKAKASDIERYFDVKKINFYHLQKSNSAYVLTGYKFNRHLTLA